MIICHVLSLQHYYGLYQKIYPCIYFLLPVSAKHKNCANKRNLTKSDNINQLWKTDIHNVRAYNNLCYLMAVEYCFSKRWLSYNFSRTFTAKVCVKSIEEDYPILYNSSSRINLILRVDNSPQYIAKSFKDTVRLLNIPHGYIEKQTYEDNRNIESVHN